jgi:hypothetical protein
LELNRSGSRKTSAEVEYDLCAFQLMKTRNFQELRMIKNIFMAALVLIALTGCSVGLTEDDLPILKVNDQHMILENQPGEPYELPPGPGFALQLSGYKFKLPETLGVDHVNSIQVATSPEQTYIIPIDPKITLYRVTSDTLTPIVGSAPFPGLEEGENISIGVGYTFPDGRFYPSWMGVISVTGEKP